MNRTTFWVALIGGGILAIPMVRNLSKKEEVTEGNEESFFAFVNDLNGTIIFENPGEQSITRLPDKVYIGALIGPPINGFIPVQSTIDGNDYQFWVRRSEVTIIESRDEARQFRLANNSDKTVDMKRAIKNYFI